LKISMPIPESPQIPGLGQFSGTATYFIGFATAEIPPPGGIPTSAGTTGDSPSPMAPVGVQPNATLHPAGTPLAAMLNQPVASAPTPSGAVAAPPPTAPVTVAAPPTVLTHFEPVAAPEFSGKDIRSVYLLAVAAVVAAIAAGLRIVRLGAVK